LRELVAACAEVKIEPLFCAPTAAATDVLRKEGFEAKTLQSLLLTKPKLDERWLVVLDEAGAVGIDDMKRLFDLARDAHVCFPATPASTHRWCVVMHCGFWSNIPIFNPAN
jgi:hypothetical protein